MPATRAILLLLLAAAPAWAVSAPAEPVQIIEHVGAKVPLDLPFVDEHGRKVVLGDYFDGQRPVLVTLVYYQCPQLCSLMLNGVVDSLRPLGWRPGADYRVVTLSINHREKADVALAKKQSYLEMLGKEGAGDGWAFLTGDQPDIRKLAGTLGWGYRYDPDTMEYIHGAAVMVLSPDGTVVRYLHGARPGESQMKLALLDAGGGALGGLGDALLSRLYSYDEAARKYAVDIVAALTLSGLIALPFAALLLLLGVRRRGRSGPSTTEPTGPDLMVRGVIPNG